MDSGWGARAIQQCGWLFAATLIIRLNVYRPHRSQARGRDREPDSVLVVLPLKADGLKIVVVT
jgi:hypothetical protein